MKDSCRREGHSYSSISSILDYYSARDNYLVDGGLCVGRSLFYYSRAVDRLSPVGGLSGGNVRIASSVSERSSFPYLVDSSGQMVGDVTFVINERALHGTEGDVLSDDLRILTIERIESLGSVTDLDLMVFTHYSYNSALVLTNVVVTYTCTV